MLQAWPLSPRRRHRLDDAFLATQRHTCRMEVQPAQQVQYNFVQCTSHALKSQRSWQNEVTIAPSRVIKRNETDMAHPAGSHSRAGPKWHNTRLHQLMPNPVQLLPALPYNGSTSGVFESFTPWHFQPYSAWSVLLTQMQGYGQVWIHTRVQTLDTSVPSQLRVPSQPTLTSYATQFLKSLNIHTVGPLSTH
jgi:hypothetical protein